MQQVSGLGKTDRKRLATLIRGTKGTVSVRETATILEVSSTEAAKMLARWASKGWLSRVRRGLYVLVPLESGTPDVPLEDPWVIANRLYSPCYIGGWSAAEHWGMTEQVFRTVLVMTTMRPRDRRPVFKGTSFLLRTISQEAMFGLKSVWRGQVTVSVSDPARTIVDMLADPSLGGGIRSTADVLNAYLRTETKNISLLTEYAARLGNGAVFKRLGFLLERFAPEEREAVAASVSRLTKGRAKLDPSLSADKLVTRWRLWVPDNWKAEAE
ncbi:MAG: type IV toxin-antitoxin system AbiEi family antitoxin domain-containing protein [Syntrophorhabdales bacterium]|jgi:predicted transcriptional regulator of viral defense system